MSNENKLTPEPASKMDTLTANEAMPDVQPHAIAAIKQEKQESLDEAREKGFDPDIHETDADGKPVKTRTGKFRKKRGVKSDKAKSKLNLRSDGKKEPQTEEKKKVEIDSLTAAATTSAILERIQVGMIGEDMTYDEAQKQRNVNAWYDLYEHYGGLEVHPALAVAADHTMILIEKSQKPKVKSKFKKLTENIAAKLVLWRNKNALFNRGKNAKRENDVREKEGAVIEETGNKDISS